MPTYIVRSEDGRTAIVEAYTIPQALDRINATLDDDDKFNAETVHTYDGEALVITDKEPTT